MRAFVFGKFLPFHKGHQAMIEFAKTKAKVVTVVICAHEDESIPAEIREKWIKQTVGGVEIVVLKYKDLPVTSEASETASGQWATAFKTMLFPQDLVITSEPYGEMVARYMEIRHIAFDPGRKMFPISATQIRQNPAKYWKYIPEAVRPWFCRKVVILGTECTGKTVLTIKLAKSLGWGCVLEAGRDLIPHSDDFAFEDLTKVAEEHSRRIIEVSKKLPFIVIDTDIQITKSYSRFAFSKGLKVSREIEEANKADLYLYLNNDVPFIQDGTRMSEGNRNLLDKSHRKEIKTPVVEISGDWDERFNKSLKAIKDYFGGKHLTPMELK